MPGFCAPGFPRIALSIYVFVYVSAPEAIND